MKQVLFSLLLFCSAASLYAQTSGDYRSYKSGNWNTAIWQKYNGSTWANVTTYPTSSDGVITIQDTTDVVINLSLTVDQVIVAAGGVLEMTSGNTLTLADGAGDDLTVNGKLYFDYGTIVNPGNLKINGVFLWTGGNLQAPVTNAGITSIEDDVTLYSVFTNNATVNWTGSSLNFQNGAIENNGVFNCLTADYLYNNSGGTFNNNAAGVFNQKSSGDLSSRVAFNNKGKLNLNAGTFSVDGGTFTNTGTVNFATGSFDNQATVNLNAGTKITGTGTWNHSYNTLNINLALTFPSTVIINLNNGTIAGSGSLKTSGPVNWNDGAINVATTIASTSTVNIGSSDVQVYTTITNTGTINWTASNSISFYGGTIINNKTFNAYGNGYLYNGNGGTFTNGSAGIFNKSIGSGTLSNRITFNNNGTLNLNAGRFSNESGAVFTNTKKIAMSNGTFYNDGTVNLNPGTAITGTGKLMEGYNTMNLNDTITLPAGITFYLTNSGSATVAGTGSLKITGTMYWQNGNISLPTFIQSTGTLIIDGSSANLYSTLTNNGIVNWSANYISFYGGSLVNNSSFNIQGNNRFYNSSSGSFTNTLSGTVTKSNYGTTTVSIPFSNAGILKGIGTYDFGTYLTNTGMFAPGVDTATGILTTGTNYTNKSLVIKMKGSSPGLNYDRLTVNGNVTLGNDTLTVTATGTVPAGSYPILIWSDARTGAFKTVRLPTGYSITYQGNKVLVNVPAGFAKEAANDKVSVASVPKQILSDESFTVSPNPAGSMITITVKGSSVPAGFEIINMNGKKIKSISLSGSNSVVVNVSDLAPGTYFLKSNSKNRQAIKFIKL